MAPQEWPLYLGNGPSGRAKVKAQVGRHPPVAPPPDNATALRTVHSSRRNPSSRSTILASTPRGAGRYQDGSVALPGSNVLLPGSHHARRADSGKRARAPASAPESVREQSRLMR